MNNIINYIKQLGFTDNDDLSFSQLLGGTVFNILVLPSEEFCILTATLYVGDTKVASRVETPIRNILDGQILDVTITELVTACYAESGKLRAKEAVTKIHNNLGVKGRGWGDVTIPIGGRELQPFPDWLSKINNEKE